MDHKEKLDKLQDMKRIWIIYSDHKATKLDIHNASLKFKNTLANLKLRA